jgi:tetratricopeptide (TPR) repeat protein
MGKTAEYLGELDESERLLREAIRIHESTGFRGAESSQPYAILGKTLARLGKFSEAYASCREASIRFKDGGALVGFVSSELQLGWAAQNLGDYDAARDHAWKVHEHSQQTELLRHYAYSLAMLGGISLATATDPDKTLFLESLAILQEPGYPERTSNACSVLGYVARELGEVPKARACLSRALRYAVETRAFNPLITSLPALALLLADEGDAARAVELYALASRYPYVANSRWFEDVAGKHIAAVAATLPPDVVAAAQEHGRARDLWETAEELLEELADVGN